MCGTMFEAIYLIKVPKNDFGTKPNQSWDETQKEDEENDIKIEEIKETIKNLKAGKASGPDRVFQRW